MATMSIARELRARLRGRREALTQMGELYELKQDDDTDFWWIHKSTLYSHDHTADHDPPERFRDGAEALALLSVLARVDYTACVSEVRALRPHRPLHGPIWKKQVGAIGFDYTFWNATDIVPIIERVVGTDPPTQQYMDDFVWLKNAIASRGGELRMAPIPVRLKMYLQDSTPELFASTLRQVVLAVRAQQLHRQVPWDNDHTRAAASTRFEIAAVSFDLSEFTANAEALGYLTELGVRVSCLPTIQALPQESPSVIKHLHALVPPFGRQAAFIRYVHVGEETSLHLVPAVFTAIRANRAVEEVAVSVQRDLSEEWNETQRATACSVWKWAAYTLFSRRAASHVKQVTLHVDYLDRLVLSAVEDVIRADNPLPVVLGTMDEGGQQWVKASRFLLGHPDGAEQAWFVTEEALIVEVLATFDSHGKQWRHVLLPGYGPAFVTTTGSVEVPSTDIQLHEESAGAIDLYLEGLDSDNVEDVASFLQMIPRKIDNITVASVDRVQAPFDMTDWTLAVLDHFSGLKGLDLPMFARLSSLKIFVDSAEADKSHLQRLNLFERFEADSPDLIAFLAVLSNPSHPLTRNLKELLFVVSAPIKVPVEFTTAWFGMLARNRTLRSVNLTVNAREPLKMAPEKVAIRTGPMALSSKLAFLSALQDANSSNSARTQLDASVTATIFEFAAQHQLRHLVVGFDME